MRIEYIDHIVLTVADITRTCEFYERVLGMEAVTFEEGGAAGRTALRFGRQKINLHESGKEFEPKATRPTPGSADLCFIVTSELDEVITRLDTRGVAVVEGPVRRTGARGAIESVYLRDPDGNLIEIARYLDTP